MCVQVDKTFAYVKTPEYDGTNLRALLAAHHSSQVVGDDVIQQGLSFTTTPEEIVEERETQVTCPGGDPC